jgi:hypothetical protein
VAPTQQSGLGIRTPRTDLGVIEKLGPRNTDRSRNFMVLGGAKRRLSVGQAPSIPTPRARNTVRSGKKC